MKRLLSLMTAGLAVSALVVSMPIAALAHKGEVHPAGRQIAQAPAAKQPMDHSTMTPQQMQQHGTAPPEQTQDHSTMTPEQMQQHGPVTPEKTQDHSTMTPEQMLEHEQMKDQAAPAADKTPAKRKKP